MLPAQPSDEGLGREEEEGAHLVMSATTRRLRWTSAHRLATHDIPPKGLQDDGRHLVDQAPPREVLGFAQQHAPQRLNAHSTPRREPPIEPVRLPSLALLDLIQILEVLVQLPVAAELLLGPLGG